MIDIGRFSKLAAAATVAAVMSVGSVSAATDIITINPYDDPEARGSVSCSLGCVGWIFDGAPDRDLIAVGSWDDEYADLFNAVQGPGGSNPSNYLTLINAVVGPNSYILSDLTRANTEGSGEDRFDGDPDGTISFTTSSEYFFLTLGLNPRIALFQNLAAGNLITYTAEGQGAGLSHITEVGVIPLPAAGWLMLGVFGVGAAAARRKRKQAQTA